MINFIVNGEKKKSLTEVPLASLLKELKVPAALCVVEKNGEIVSRKKYKTVLVKNGDKLEIIRMMGGG